MGFVLNLVLSIVGVVLVGGTVWVVVWLNSRARQVDVDPNMPIIDCTLRKQFTNGYTLGLMKPPIPLKNRAYRISMLPIDAEQGESKVRPEVQTFVVAKDYLKVFSRGESSARREVVKIVARDPSEMPKKMRDTLEGKWSSAEGQLAFMTQTFGKAISAGDQAIHELMGMYARGNITKATAAMLKEQNKSILGLVPSQEKQQEGSVDNGKGVR